MAVAPEGFDLPGVEGVRIVDIASDPPKTPGAMDRPEYRAWLHLVAERVTAASGISPLVRMDTRDVVANLMRAGGKDYLVLVNNNRTRGPRATYPNAPEEKGLRTRVKVAVDGVERATDVGTGGAVPVKNGTFTVTLEPGWGKIVRLDRR